MNMPTLERDHPFNHQGNLNRLRPMLMKNLSNLVVPNLLLLWMDILSLSSSMMVWPMPPPLENPQSGHGHISTFNEYAYLGKGSSIQSSGQLEWFKTHVDEKSFEVGGTQLITTLDGYSVPLLIKDGLAYATSLGKPTDHDMDTYPHVFFTSPDEWDPSVLDHDPPHLDGLDISQVPDQPLVTPSLMPIGI